MLSASNLPDVHCWDSTRCPPVLPNPVHPAAHEVVHEIIRLGDAAEDAANHASFVRGVHLLIACVQCTIVYPLMLTRGRSDKRCATSGACRKMCAHAHQSAFSRWYPANPAPLRLAQPRSLRT
jgi:hypothetical protein